MSILAVHSICGYVSRTFENLVRVERCKYLACYCCCCRRGAVVLCYSFVCIIYDCDVAAFSDPTKVVRVQTKSTRELKQFYAQTRVHEAAFFEASISRLPTAASDASPKNGTQS